MRYPLLLWLALFGAVGLFQPAMFDSTPQACLQRRLRGGGAPGRSSAGICCQHNATAAGNMLPVRLVLQRNVPQICAACAKLAFGENCSVEANAATSRVVGEANSAASTRICTLVAPDGLTSDPPLRWGRGGRMKHDIFVPQADDVTSDSGMNDERPHASPLELEAKAAQTGSRHTLSCDAFVRQGFECAVTSTVDALLGLDAAAADATIRTRLVELIRSDLMSHQEPDTAGAVLGTEGVHGKEEELCKELLAGKAERVSRVIGQTVDLARADRNSRGSPLSPLGSQHRQFHKGCAAVGPAGGVDSSSWVSTPERGAHAHVGGKNATEDGCRDELLKERVRDKWFCALHQEWVKDAQDSGERKARLGCNEFWWIARCTRNVYWDEWWSSQVKGALPPSPCPPQGRLPGGDRGRADGMRQPRAREVRNGRGLDDNGMAFLGHRNALVAALEASFWRDKGMRCRVLASVRLPCAVCIKADNQLQQPRVPHKQQPRALAPPVSEPRSGALQMPTGQTMDKIEEDGADQRQRLVSDVLREVWIEIWHEASDSWLPISAPSDADSLLPPDVPSLPEATPSCGVRAHVLAVEDGAVRDVTWRYVRRWAKVAAHRALSDRQGRLDVMLAQLSRRHVRVQDDAALAADERALWDSRLVNEPLPTSVAGVDGSPFFALMGLLRPQEMLRDATPAPSVLGTLSVNGQVQTIISRRQVTPLRTRQQWADRLCLVRKNERPVRVVRHQTLRRPSAMSPAEMSYARGGGEPLLRELFADWQVDVMRVGCAQNGSVPKDERGQVCALNQLTLPFGTAHVRSAGATLVARRLKIDYAPALVGWTWRGSRALPLFDGVVVCADYVRAVRAASAARERGSVMGLGGVEAGRSADWDRDQEGKEESEEEEVGDYERERAAHIHRNNQVLAQLGFAALNDEQGNVQGKKNESGSPEGVGTTQDHQEEALTRAKAVMEELGQVSVRLLKWFSKSAATRMRGEETDSHRRGQERIAHVLLWLQDEVTMAAGTFETDSNQEPQGFGTERSVNKRFADGEFGDDWLAVAKEAIKEVLTLLSTLDQTQPLHQKEGSNANVLPIDMVLEILTRYIEILAAEIDAVEGVPNVPLGEESRPSWCQPEKLDASASIH